MSTMTYLKSTLSLEEYLELRTKQDKGTGRLTKGAVSNAKLFCQDQYQKEFITVLSDMRDHVLETHQLDVCLLFLQKLVYWMAEPHLHLRMTPSAICKQGVPCIAKDVVTIKGYIAQIRLVMKKVGGIPISSEDVKDYRLWVGVKKISKCTEQN